MSLPILYCYTSCTVGEQGKLTLSLQKQFFCIAYIRQDTHYTIMLNVIQMTI